MDMDNFMPTLEAVFEAAGISKRRTELEPDQTNASTDAKQR